VGEVVESGWKTGEDADVEYEDRLMFCGCLVMSTGRLICNGGCLEE